jgi:hypothetical protein
MPNISFHEANEVAESLVSKTNANYLIQNKREIDKLELTFRPCCIAKNLKNISRKYQLFRYQKMITGFI